jgi:hypothetical protein
MKITENHILTIDTLYGAPGTVVRTFFAPPKRVTLTIDRSVTGNAEMGCVLGINQIAGIIIIDVFAAQQYGHRIEVQKDIVL